MLCNTQFHFNTVICIKKFFFSFCIVDLLVFKSETSLNYSTFEQQDFVKTQNYDSNDVIVTSYNVVSLLTRRVLIKLGMNCELSKDFLDSFNCKKLLGFASQN